MKRIPRTAYLIIPVLILALAVLACGAGYQTSRKLVGSSGEVRVKMKDASGANSTEVEISEDWPDQRVGCTVTLSVESGSCQATLSGENGTAISLNASAGSPGEAYGELVTDVFGELTLDTECQSAQNMDLLVVFSAR